MSKQKEPPKTCGDCKNHIVVEFGRLECLLAEHYFPNKNSAVNLKQKACKHAK